MGDVIALGYECILDGFGEVQWRVVFGFNVYPFEVRLFRFVEVEAESMVE